ncbi:Carotene biosynthesis-related protein CBR, chloroplastic [Tetrabaena socialis]|uniref:Carotene biosynthesis-related protein CBR, chloroplastic n=1 Tax=Tetrabaena socialis TaxID=47790 RepID=A0A2J8A6D9_9CHLO|nr:Carotene biosynthesis-related protein CBR, chloroplastic [Tetrabaena socialis]|eukprot:PNH08088.1 Carotene biosynthesis-related protein CBR, chloroplastic [Tetrabaena socialis]
MAVKGLSGLRPVGVRQETLRLGQPRQVQALAAQPSTTPSPAEPRRDYSVSFFDALKFNGPAPELINGRLAMLGLVWGGWAEAHGAGTLAQQATEAPFVVAAMPLVWMYASLTPILKGAKMEPFGPFTPRAEMTNGRAAMLGIAVLLFLEDKAGVPFF